MNRSKPKHSQRVQLSSKRPEHEATQTDTPDSDAFEVTSNMPTSEGILYGPPLDFGVGAVLLQHGHLLAFFSQKLGPRRRMASTYHKELYAIVEAVQKWSQYLLVREFVIRSDQRSLKELLLQALYGRMPPLFPTMSTRSQVASVEELLRERAALLADLKTHLAAMRKRMVTQANAHRREVSNAIGDLVLLKLRLYHHHSVARPLSTKLSRRFYGPFPILKRVRPVTYRLHLPPDCHIHNVFHVSLLWPFVQTGDNLPPVTLPADFYKGRRILIPVKALAARTALVEVSRKTNN
ncbi:unnamed protein product [Cuscuta campestris]|uniref:Uncharacterized protein n=1 Tax=Cuscuta campestris TaxID=132261 RepID=A0A484ML98_9ASTE|nr:unnamed protein product [Cuscuta campestris]